MDRLLRTAFVLILSVVLSALAWASPLESNQANKLLKGHPLPADSFSMNDEQGNGLHPKGERLAKRDDRSQGRQRKARSNKSRDRINKVLNRIKKDRTQRKQAQKKQRIQNAKAPNKTEIRKAKVELFVTSWCPHCQSATRYLRSLGVSFSKYDVEQSPSAKARKEKISPGSGVPVAVINGKVLKGFSQESYKRALMSGN